jgi:hypothetical protein
VRVTTVTFKEKGKNKGKKGKNNIRNNMKSSIIKALEKIHEGKKKVVQYQ